MADVVIEFRDKSTKHFYSDASTGETWRVMTQAQFIIVSNSVGTDHIFPSEVIFHVRSVDSKRKA